MTFTWRWIVKSINPFVCSANIIQNEWMLKASIASTFVVCRYVNCHMLNEMTDTEQLIILMFYYDTKCTRSYWRPICPVLLLSPMPPDVHFHWTVNGCSRYNCSSSIMNKYHDLLFVVRNKWEWQANEWRW